MRARKRVARAHLRQLILFSTAAVVTTFNLLTRGSRWKANLRGLRGLTELNLVRCRLSPEPSQSEEVSYAHCSNHHTCRLQQFCVLTSFYFLNVFIINVISNATQNSILTTRCIVCYTLFGTDGQQNVVKL